MAPPTPNTVAVSGTHGISFDGLTLTIKPDKPGAKKSRFNLDTDALVTLYKETSDTMTQQLYKAEAKAKSAKRAKYVAKAKAAEAKAKLASMRLDENSFDSSQSTTDEVDALPIAAFEGITLNKEEEVVETQQLDLF